MRYIDWVEKVALTFAGLEKQHQQAQVGQIKQALHVEHDQAREVEDAVWDAVEDLDAITVLNAINQYQIAETENTRKLRAGAALSTVWRSFFDTFIEPEPLEFLRASAGIAEVQRDGFATVQWITAVEVFEALGWDTAGNDAITRGHVNANQLEESGLIRTRRTTGSLSGVAFRPTYRGIVFATQQLTTEWQQRLAAMVEEWETTTVEFKREVRLNTWAQKGEFVKDTLGLATTKASGRERYLVIGYDNATRTFAQSADSLISQDRLEQILAEYAEPMPELRYLRVPMPNDAEAGVIEVRRDPAKIPYRARRDIGRVKAGDIFVRHGSQTEPPTELERQELEQEGRRAREATE
jgi:hypothetical protein